MDQITTYQNINSYFVGSGDYNDGARAANDLREAALYLSMTGFFLTGILLIISAVASACSKSVKILTKTLV